MYLALYALRCQRSLHNARKIGTVFKYRAARNLEHGRLVLVVAAPDIEEIPAKRARQGGVPAVPGEPQGPVIQAWRRHRCCCCCCCSYDLQLLDAFHIVTGLLCSRSDERYNNLVHQVRVFSGLLYFLQEHLERFAEGE